MRGERSWLLIVDAANVVGSVPDGWWRDRPAATRRLRDALATSAVTGLPGFPAPLDVVLVVEGVSTEVDAVAGVDVVRATGSGDDAIVELVQTSVGRWQCAVVTADRQLRRRVDELGAVVVSPRLIRGPGRSVRRPNSPAPPDSDVSFWPPGPDAR